MAFNRQVFQIETDTGGDFVDTGPPSTGFVMQMRLDTDALDTGCDFLLEGVSSGVVVADYDNAGGSAWTRVPRLLTFDTGGTEIGDAYPVLNGERLRLTVNQSAGVTGSVSAKLYVWTSD